MSAPLSQAVPAPSRGRKTALDMVWSMAAIGAVVAAVVLLVPRSDRPVVQPVDLDAAVQAAESAGDVPVVNPALDDDWQLTSARREAPEGPLPATWHLGWLSPGQEYVGLEAARRSTPDWVREVTSDGEEASALDVAGETWTVYRSGEPDESGRVSLLLETPEGVMVVTGSAVLDELAEVAKAALAAAP